MEKNGAKAYLVNTGWNGTGKRISIKDTRGIIDAILDGAIKTAPTKKILTSISKFLPSWLVLTPVFWIPEIPTLILPSGKRRQRIWLRDSSRTSLNTKEMMLVRLWLLLVLSCNLTLQTNANMEGCLFGDSLFCR